MAKMNTVEVANGHESGLTGEVLWTSAHGAEFKGVRVIHEQDNPSLAVSEAIVKAIGRTRVRSTTCWHRGSRRYRGRNPIGAVEGRGFMGKRASR
ncbi:MAG TPA: hypothetical protein PLJ27_03665 [Polyangiaceae bacterium]|nr:hypothetical protein [Polyangiaceae bacterium]